jgi:hypothetical protein
MKWFQSDEDERLMKSEKDVLEAKLEVATDILVENLANRIQRNDGELGSRYDRYVEICAELGIQPGTNRDQPRFQGHFSPRERKQIDRLRRGWISMTGQIETYQEFFDRMLVKAEVMVKDRESKAVADKVTTEVETKSDSNRAVSDSGLNDSEAIMSDNNKTRTL